MQAPMRVSRSFHRFVSEHVFRIRNLTKIAPDLLLCSGIKLSSKVWARPQAREYLNLESPPRGRDLKSSLSTLFRRGSRSGKRPLNHCRTAPAPFVARSLD